MYELTLCIVQDDIDEWARESAAMDQIYENAYVTVAATASANCTRSMFEQSSEPPKVLEGTSSAGRQYSWMFQTDRHQHHVQSVFLANTLETCPLTLRGWAFQERPLSRRTMHFVKQELVLECLEETLCGCGSRKNAPLGDDKVLEWFPKRTAPHLGVAWRGVVAKHSLTSICRFNFTPTTATSAIDTIRHNMDSQSKPAPCPLPLDHPRT